MPGDGKDMRNDRVPDRPGKENYITADAGRAEPRAWTIIERTESQMMRPR